MKHLDDPSEAFDLLCGAIASTYPSMPVHLVETTARRYAEDRSIAYTALCVAAGSEPQARLTAKVAAHEDAATVALIIVAANRSKWNASAAAAAADLVILAIGDDVAKGVMPWDVPDFSALHDFVDANEYGLTQYMGGLLMDHLREAAA